ncbi:MAG TPA: adenylate/guanylate cyclase domain-containing protein [Allocoleopsis sp.]
MNDNTDKERLKRTLYRYMSQELAEELLKRDDGTLGGERQEASILFSDIRGATTLMECLEDEEVAALLNDYFELMVEAIFKYRGIVPQYWGDAIMAVFGSPFPLENHAWSAVQTALEMRHQLAEFNSCRAAIGKIPIHIGIGINSARVFTGNIGSTRRMDFTVVGHGVNLASRLEGISKFYGCDIVISETTYNACADRIWARELDRVRPKGMNQPVTIYEVVGLRSEPISEQKQQAIEAYHKGREYYLNGKFRRATSEFGYILEELDKNDKAAALHFDRCQQFLQSPPPDDWDGVYTYTEI